jgi:NAD(P)-dependent dehydrogenase (short-subunit alcohol dehydrogenase family)
VTDQPLSVIAGMGPTIGTPLARTLLDAGHRVIGISRSASAKPTFALNTGEHFSAVSCDLTVETAVAGAFTVIGRDHGPVRNVFFTAGELIIEGLAETTASAFEHTWRINVLGAFLCAKAAVPQMLSQGGGTLLFVGATASIRGGARFSAFASSKFALRGLAQSLAREHGASGIHVAHVVIDGLIWGDAARDMHNASRERCLDPNDVAASLLAVANQPKSCWVHELDLRPWSERF